MRRVVATYFDDILFLGGVICLVCAGALLHPALAWGVGGAGLIVYSFIVARGGGKA